MGTAAVLTEADCDREIDGFGRWLAENDQHPRDEHAVWCRAMDYVSESHPELGEEPDEDARATAIIAMLIDAWCSL